MSHAEKHSASWFEAIDKMTMDYILLTGYRPSADLQELIKIAADTATQKTAEWRLNESKQPVLYMDGRVFGDK